LSLVRATLQNKKKMQEFDIEFKLHTTQSTRTKNNNTNNKRKINEEEEEEKKKEL